MKLRLTMFLAPVFLAAASQAFAGSYPVHDWTHGRPSGNCTSNVPVTGSGDVEGVAMQCEADGSYVVTARVPLTATGLGFAPIFEVSTASTTGTGCFTVCTATVAPGDVVGNLDYGNCQVVSIAPSETPNEVVVVTAPGATLSDGAAGNCDGTCAGRILYVSIGVGTVGGCTHNNTNPWNIYGSTYHFAE